MPFPKVHDFPTRSTCHVDESKFTNIIFNTFTAYQNIGLEQKYKRNENKYMREEIYHIGK